MKFRLRKVLLRLHFVALAIAILNFLLKTFLTYSLARNIELGIEILTAISGLVLFFFHIKPFKKINFYFSVYAVIASLSVIGLVFRGVIGALILSFFLLPIIPDRKRYEYEGIIISTPFQGFMASCCTYQIKERKLLFFEKDYGTFESAGSIDFESIKIKITEHEIELTYQTGFENRIERIKK